MLFSSKWAALVKLLLVRVLWRSRSMLCPSGWMGYWYSAGLRQLGQQPPAAGAWWSLCSCPWAHTPTNTNNFSITFHPHPAIGLVSLNCLWLGHSLQGKELSCTAFLGTELLWQGRENLLLVLGGKHKTPERITPIVWRAGTKHLIGVCRLSGL